MATPVIKNVQTQAVSFGPILRYYFDRCGIARIIDDHVDLDPRRKLLTHGQAAVAMITGILFQVMQLYRICKFAYEKPCSRCCCRTSRPKNTSTIVWQTHWMACLPMAFVPENKRAYRAASIKPKPHSNNWSASSTATNSKAMMPSTRLVRPS